MKRTALFTTFVLLTALLAFTVTRPKISRDIPYFIKQGEEQPIPPSLNDTDARALCYERSDCYMVIVTPLGFDHRETIADVTDRVGSLLYRKTVTIPEEFQEQFIYQLYGSLCDAPHKWIDDRASLARHTKKRFRGGTQVEAYLITGPNVETIKEWKDAVRHTLGLATVALHVTDTPHEAQALADLLFDGPYISSQ